MAEPYYTSTPKCSICRENGLHRVAWYAVYDADSKLYGLYCLPCARKVVEMLRENNGDQDNE